MKEAASNLKGYPLDTNNIRTISLEHCKLYVPKRYYEAIIEMERLKELKHLKWTFLRKTR